jgi:hypothetical protein
VNWMSEIMRINSVVTDTTRTPMGIQLAASSISAAGGEFLNVYEANVWPGQRYDPLALLATPQATTLNSLDASGRVGGCAFLRQRILHGRPGRDSWGARSAGSPRPCEFGLRTSRNTTVSLSTMYDRSTTDLTALPSAPSPARSLAPTTSRRTRWAGSCWSARPER